MFNPEREVSPEEMGKDPENGIQKQEGLEYSLTDEEYEKLEEEEKSLSEKDYRARTGEEQERLQEIKALLKKEREIAQRRFESEREKSKKRAEERERSTDPEIVKRRTEVEEWRNEQRRELGLSSTATRDEIRDATVEKERKDWTAQLGLRPEATWEEIEEARKEWVKELTDEEFWNSSYYDRLDYFQHAIAEHAIGYALPDRHPTLEQLRTRRQELVEKLNLKKQATLREINEALRNKFGLQRYGNDWKLVEALEASGI